MGRQHIREYQAYLFTKRKLSPGSVTNHLCALRFSYIQTLKRPWSIADTPYPKKVHRLPTILSQEEVAAGQPTLEWGTWTFSGTPTGNTFPVTDTFTFNPANCGKSCDCSQDPIIQMT